MVAIVKHKIVNKIPNRLFMITSKLPSSNPSD